MKRFKKVLSLFLAVLMLVGTVPAISAAGVTFTDVSSHWAWKDGYIPYLTEKGVINGIKQADGTYMFKPENAVTRAQYVKMLVETFGLTDTKEIDYDNFVPDEWYYTYFEKAAAQGFLVNYGKDVNPNAPITREEAVALTVRYLEVSSAEMASEKYFTDTNKISSWYKDDVLLAVGTGIIDGIKQSNGTYMFKPQNTLTRAQALTIIYKAAGCIFDGSTAARDKEAHSVNNTINKGSMTISGVTFSGRNIITEGADDGKITLTNCKINGTLYVRGGADLVLNGTTAGEIIVSGGGNVTLKNNAKVEMITLDTTAEIEMSTGCKIGLINIKASAENTKITGKGDIEELTINAKGFSTAVVPTKYTVASGISALIGTSTTEGSNASGEAFVTAPYATSDGSKYSINVMTSVGGTVKVYYTNEKNVPTTTEFEYIHSGSKYAYKFSVKANELTSKTTVDVATGSKYKYVVVQLVSGPTKYKPVVISNSVLQGNGFNTEPEFIAKTYDISINPEADSTIYWYYSTDGSVLSQGQFLLNYEKTEKALKGTMIAKGDKETLLSINSIYTKTYSFVCIMAADAADNYYAPVVVSVGDSDFTLSPELYTADSISCTPGVTGTLYYYFSKSASLPSKKDYINKYNATSYRNKLSVKANEEVIFTFNSDLTEGYPYIIFALADANGNFSQPCALYAKSNTGFTSNPSLIGNNTVEFTAPESGTVVYYLSETNRVPESGEFMEIYEGVSSNLRGTMDVSGGKAATIKYDGDYVVAYPYMMIMFVTKKNVKYFPTVVALKNQTDYSAVYATDPTHDGKGTVSFVTNFSGYIYYFFSDDARINSDFYKTWQDVGGSEKHVFANANSAIAVPEGNSKRYLHIGFSHTDELDMVGIQIIRTATVDLEKEEEPEKLTGTGFSYTLISATLFITPQTTGVLNYYKTNDVTTLPAGDFQSAYAAAVEKGTKGITSPSTFSLSAGAYKYVVLQMKNGNGDFYDYIVVETTSGDAIDDNQPTTHGFSRSPQDEHLALSGKVFGFTAEVDGIMNISFTLGNNTQKITEISVTAGQHYTFNLTSTIQTLKNNLNTTQVPLVDFNFQIVSGDKRYQTLTMGIEEFR